ncbi:MAG: asparagine synthase (glutamine-hydrolyzing) [Bacteroidota bacterium]
MCGIFGIIAAPGHLSDTHTLQKGTRLLSHRGPDGEGFFQDGQVALGHRRLAIIDLSEKGRQPMQAFGRTITYNGELYNYREIRASLEAAGQSFHSQSDTEVILGAYAQWGAACLDRFRGMWAFAIYEPERRQLFCARDPFGIKPFYYTIVEDHFYFASEIKAFRAIPAWEAKVNFHVAVDFLNSATQHHRAESLYKGVWQLMPGQWLCYDLEKGTFNCSNYLQLRTNQTLNIPSFEQAAKGLEAALRQSVRLHLRSDVSIGTSLSGGLDSSAIMALAQQEQDGTFSPEAFSYCPGIEGYDESTYIDLLIERYQLHSHKIRTGLTELDRWHDRLIQVQDGPLAAANCIANYMIYQEAKRKNLKVMLCGQGADELLGGYGTFYMPFLKELAKRNPLAAAKESLYLMYRYPKGISGLAQRLLPKTNYHQFFKYKEILPKQVTQDTTEAAPFKQHSLHNLQHRPLPALLHYEDRNSMAHGIEARIPFLDPELVQFCLGLPATYKIRKGVRKAILRKALAHQLPQPILQRYDKMGFVTPQDLWIEQSPEVVLQRITVCIDRNPEWLEPTLVKWVRHVLQKKQRQHYPFLWRLMSFGRWVRTL